MNLIHTATIDGKEYEFFSKEGKIYTVSRAALVAIGIPSGSIFSLIKNEVDDEDKYKAPGKLSKVYITKDGLLDACLAYKLTRKELDRKELEMLDKFMGEFGICRNLLTHATIETNDNDCISEYMPQTGDIVRLVSHEGYFKVACNVHGSDIFIGLNSESEYTDEVFSIRDFNDIKLAYRLRDSVSSLFAVQEPYAIFGEVEINQFLATYMKKVYSKPKRKVTQSEIDEMFGESVEIVL